MTRGFKDVHRAFDVHTLIEGRFFKTWTNASSRGQMNHLIKAIIPECRIDGAAIGDIAFKKLKSLSPGLRQRIEILPLERRFIKWIQVVEHAHTLPFAQ